MRSCRITDEVIWWHAEFYGRWALALGLYSVIERVERKRAPDNRD